jgi:glycosyltransferase involved in cell wall biosynthesis
MNQDQPFFSIIVPTFNRPAHIATCLESLACLDYPLDRFEVIVVNDGSQTCLETLVASFSNRVDIVLTHQTHGGPAKARNTGAQKAKGEFLAFTDDDCVPAANWLQALAVRVRGNRNVMIGGKTLNTLPNNLFSTVTQLLIDYLYRCHNHYPDEARFFTSNNLALPADLFHSANGFDISFPLAAGEDRDFCERWLHDGNHMTYAPEVLVYHTHVLNFHTFWRKHFIYGRGAYRYHQAKAQRGFGPFRPNLKYYLRLILNPLMEKKVEQALGVTALLMISQVANSMGFIWEWLTYAEKR